MGSPSLFWGLSPPGVRNPPGLKKIRKRGWAWWDPPLYFGVLSGARWVSEKGGTQKVGRYHRHEVDPHHLDERHRYSHPARLRQRTKQHRPRDRTRKRHLCSTHRGGSCTWRGGRRGVSVMGGWLPCGVYVGIDVIADHKPTFPAHYGPDACCGCFLDAPRAESRWLGQFPVGGVITEIALCQRSRS